MNEHISSGNLAEKRHLDPLEAEGGSEELKMLARELGVILDSSSVGITKVINRIQVRSNRAMYKIFGFHQGELENSETSKLYPSQKEYERIGQEGYLQLASGFDYNDELQMRRKDGSLIWIYLQGRAIDPQNPDEGTVWTFEDITDRKKAEKALLESESRFKDFFEHSGDAFLIVDNGMFIDCNNATIKLLGYEDKEEVIHHSPSAFSPERQPDGRLSSEKADEMTTLAFAAGSNRFEWSHLKADGSEFPVEVLLTPMTLENRVVLHVIWRDLTERKQLELREQNRLSILEKMAAAAPLQELLDSVVGFVEQCSRGSLCSLLIADNDGERLLHGSAPSLPGFFNDAVNGLKITKDVGSCGTAAFLRKRVIVEDIESHPYWIDFKPARDAELRAWWSEPILSTDGELLGILSIYHRKPCLPTESDSALIESAVNLASIAMSRVREIEYRTILEEHVRQMQKIDAIGQLAGGIAHDFNNLLTPIVVYAEMVRADLGDGHRSSGRVDGILTAANKSKELTRQLLSFSRKQDLTMTGVDLNEIITSFTDILRRTVRGDIKFVIELAPGGTHIFADQVQMEQVLLNLAVNAQDAINDIGTVTIETGHVIFDDEYVRLNPGIKPGVYIMLAVSDDGCGMTEEVIQHIFEPFFTTKALGRGTGLGLATTFGIIKQHEGHIKVHSKVGTGTTFQIYFPEHSVLTRKIDEQETGKSLPVQGAKTILFVDDNEMIIDMVSDLLPLYGYDVLSAVTPLDALAVADAHAGDIDLLITDVIMPGMNGQELYERLENKYSKLPVLYISGYKHDVVLRGGRLEEKVNFVSKPFSTEQLISKIQHIFDVMV